MSEQPNLLQEKDSLTQRQQREAEYYDQYAQVRPCQGVDFRPIEPTAHAPWNPYWHVFQVVRELAGARPGRVLDFGCGDGYASMLYARLGYAVDGFDISAANVTRASQQAQSYGYIDRCRFAQMSAEHLEYPDAAFDVVVGIDVLHHVDIPRAIAEVRRVLDPSGVAIFKEPVSVPGLDALRNSYPVRRLLPPGKSFSVEHHVTDDERKLSRDDLQLIRSSFASVTTRRFGFASRLSRLLPLRGRVRPLLQRLDALLLRLPSMDCLGDEVVMVCRK